MDVVSEWCCPNNVSNLDVDRDVVAIHCCEDSNLDVDSILAIYANLDLDVDSNLDVDANLGDANFLNGDVAANLVVDLDVDSLATFDLVDVVATLDADSVMAGSLLSGLDVVYLSLLMYLLFSMVTMCFSSFSLYFFFFFDDLRSILSRLMR